MNLEAPTAFWRSTAQRRPHPNSVSATASALDHGTTSDAGGAADSRDGRDGRAAAGPVKCAAFASLNIAF